MTKETETVLWEARPSVWMFPSFALALAACLFVVGIPWAVCLWLDARCTLYRLTSQRLIWRRGVLDRRQDQVELYRVRDVSLVQPFVLRTMGLGNVLVYSSDITTPLASILAVRDAPGVAELVRAAVEEARARFGIRALDVETVGRTAAG